MVFAIHQNELAISIHMSPPSWTPLPPPFLPHPYRLVPDPMILGAERVLWKHSRCSRKLQKSQSLRSASSGPSTGLTHPEAPVAMIHCPLLVYPPELKEIPSSPLRREDWRPQLSLEQLKQMRGPREMATWIEGPPYGLEAQALCWSVGSGQESSHQIFVQNQIHRQRILLLPNAQTSLSPWSLWKLKMLPSEWADRRVVGRNVPQSSRLSALARSDHCHLMPIFP